MKRLLLLISTLVLLVGCGENEYEKDLREAKIRLEEAKEDTKRLEETSKQIDETNKSLQDLKKKTGIEDDEVVEDDSNELDELELKELLEYVALGENDNIKDLVLEGDEIKAAIEIGDHEIFDDKKLLAEVIYASAGDELLQTEGWEVLTIDFLDVGKVSMHRSDKESNEYGDYFPTEEILKQLGSN